MPAAEAVEAAARPPRHVYVHIPFCRAKCDYCAFCSCDIETLSSDGRGLDDLFDRFVDAVRAEWAAERHALGIRSLHTLYLGGGTPSLLGVERLERLLRAFQPLLTSRAEVTVETNPEDVDERYAAWAAERRVRVSLGVQSFLEHTRRALGRTTRSDPAAAFRRLRAAGCENVGVDLIFGVPAQTIADVGSDLVAVAALGPDHVSWYELDVVAGTPLGRRLLATSDTRASDTPASDDLACDAPASGEPARDDLASGAPASHEAASGEPASGCLPAVADADVGARMYELVIDGLARLGYSWYEVSNFARPQRRCRHNGAVWRGEDYLGLGPSAVSTLCDVRRRDGDDLDAYLACADGAPPPRREERLDAPTRLRERLYLAARTGTPVSAAEMEPVLDCNAVDEMAAAGFVSRRGGTLAVTRKGRHVADAVCVRLFRAFC